MSPLIALLLNLLITFITSLIEKWIKAHLGLPTAEVLKSEKDSFVKSVRWRVWLGPNRVAKAAEAYDLALINYNGVLLARAGQTSHDASAIAKSIVAPVGPQL